MSQISHWMDLSQVYNSKRRFYKILSEDTRDVSKVRASILRDGDKIKMPRCPANNQASEVARVSVNRTAAGIVPNGCLACSIPPSQRNSPQNPNRFGPPVGRVPGQKSNCFIGGK